MTGIYAQLPEPYHPSHGASSQAEHLNDLQDLVAGSCDLGQVAVYFSGLTGCFVGWNHLDMVDCLFIDEGMHV